MFNCARLTLQPATKEDREESLQLFLDCRLSDDDVQAMPAELRVDYVCAEFDRRHQSYRLDFPGVLSYFILIDGDIAGRLYLQEGLDNLFVVDIALRPEWRNQGWGSRLLTNLEKTARKLHKSLRLHVQKSNHGAYRLYKKLGFQVIDEAGDEAWLMDWSKLTVINSVANNLRHMAAVI
jgi:ribosomal protein S18 acetylase RimI-like enzyme